MLVQAMKIYSISNLAFVYGDKNVVDVCSTLHPIVIASHSEYLFPMGIVNSVVPFIHDQDRAHTLYLSTDSVNPDSVKTILELLEAESFTIQAADAHTVAHRLASILTTSIMRRFSHALSRYLSIIDTYTYSRLESYAYMAKSTARPFANVVEFQDNFSDADVQKALFGLDLKVVSDGGCYITYKGIRGEPVVLLNICEVLRHVYTNYPNSVMHVEFYSLLISVAVGMLLKRFWGQDYLGNLTRLERGVLDSVVFYHNANELAAHCIKHAALVSTDGCFESLFSTLVSKDSISASLEDISTVLEETTTHPTYRLDPQTGRWNTISLKAPVFFDHEISKGLAQDDYTWFCACIYTKRSLTYHADCARYGIKYKKELAILNEELGVTKRYTGGTYAADLDIKVGHLHGQFTYCVMREFPRADDGINAEVGLFNDPQFVEPFMQGKLSEKRTRNGHESDMKVPIELAGSNLLEMMLKPLGLTEKPRKPSNPFVDKNKV